MATIRKRCWTTADGAAREAWLVDFCDQAGRRTNKQFATRKAADTWLVKSRAQVERGIFTPDSTSPTVSEAAQLWLTRCEQDQLEPATIAGYRTHLRLYIEPRLGGLKLSRLTTPMIEFVRR